MARADLLVDLVKYSCSGNNYQYKKVIEALIADERQNKHGILADKLQMELTLLTDRMSHCNQQQNQNTCLSFETSNYLEKIEPNVTLEQLVLTDDIRKQTNEIVEEHMRADLLRSYSLEPRNKIMLVGNPGTGKTSYAIALAERLMLPLYIVKYDMLVGSYLGETANRLAKLMDFAKTNPCVLFFDEFDTLGKERGDNQETGEIKRVVSSLLLQIDSLPSYSIVIGATNHAELLDRAVWRRFQLKMEFPTPNIKALESWLQIFQEKYGLDMAIDTPQIIKSLHGHSFAEAEEWGLSLVRKYVLTLPEVNLKKLVHETLISFEENNKARS